MVNEPRSHKYTRNKERGTGSIDIRARMSDYGLVPLVHAQAKEKGKDNREKRSNPSANLKSAGQRSPDHSQGRKPSGVVLFSRVRERFTVFLQDRETEKRKNRSTKAAPGLSRGRADRHRYTRMYIATITTPSTKLIRARSFAFVAYAILRRARCRKLKGVALKLQNN